jgi:hypothetical protein
VIRRTIGQSWQLAIVVTILSVCAAITIRGDLPPGNYTLTVISDDGARVWVDGEEVIDAWSPHESRIDRGPITGGRKKFKVEYYEIGGFAELRFDIQRR